MQLFFPMRILALAAVICSAGVAGGETPPMNAALEQYKENWPVFRGWGGSGRVQGEYAAKWNLPAKEKLVWSAPLGLPGNSSPVVWGDKVFVTGATDEKREVCCYAVEGGKLLWRTEIATALKELPDVADDAGWASSTPAVDAERVYVAYATGDIAALDHDGKIIWTKSMGKPENLYGYASSLTVAGGNLIVQWDMGTDPDAKPLTAEIFALDTATGKDVWHTQRDGINAFASPTVTEDGKTVVAVGSPYVGAYDTATGKEIWRAKLMENDVACSPCIVGGVAWVANDHATLTGIAMNSKGEVKEKDLPWKGDEGLPDIVSPISNGKLVWTITAGGFVYCFDVKDGSKVYDAELKVDVKSSPVLVGDQMWVTDIKGITHVLATERVFKELGKADCGEPVQATLAFSKGKIFIRGSKHLFCVEGK